MKLTIDHIDYHRNGICGAPFHVMLFRDADEGRMLGIVFDEPYHVAVLNLDKLAQGIITFGINAWRGDWYEPGLRRAIAKYQDEQSQPEPERNPLMSAIPEHLTRIALEHLGIPTLEVRRSDSLDFHTVSVWAVHNALEAAYQAGLAAPARSSREEVSRG
jgi:hypothetical protein